MNIEYGWTVNFANVQNSLADTLGFNRLLEYEKEFYESNFILAVNDCHCIANLDHHLIVFHCH